MNTGISKSWLKLIVLGAALTALSACVPGGGGLSFAAAGKEPEGAQTGPVVPKSTRTTLAAGAVKVKAPKKYCIDETSVTNGLAGSSVRLAKCTALDGKGSIADTSAVMTVRVSPRRAGNAPTPTLDDLAAAVAPAEVIARQTQGTLNLVHVATGGNDVFAPADPRHWRGSTVLDTRLVLLSLYAPAGAPMSGPKGGALLTDLARGISVTRGSFLSRRPGQEEETDDPAQPQSEPLSDVSADNASAGEEKGLRRVFGRLFNRS